MEMTKPYLTEEKAKGLLKSLLEKYDIENFSIRNHLIEEKPKKKNKWKVSLDTGLLTVTLECIKKDGQYFRFTGKKK